MNYNIKFSQISKEELEEIQVLLATGNLTFFSFIKNSGLSFKKREAYRKVIVQNLSSHQKLIDTEVDLCKNLNKQDINHIKKIEDFKLKLLEGNIKLINDEVNKKLYLAKLIRKQRADFESEAYVAFCYAFYNYTRTDIKFNTFLITVLRNRLMDFCSNSTDFKINKKYYILKSKYFYFKNKLEQKGKKITFAKIVKLIIKSKLQKKGKPLIKENIIKLYHKHKNDFIFLMKFIETDVKKFHPLTEATTKNTYSYSYEEYQNLINELTEGLTPLQKMCLKCKLEKIPFNSLYNKFKKPLVLKAWEKVKQEAIIFLRK